MEKLASYDGLDLNLVKKAISFLDDGEALPEGELIWKGDKDGMILSIFGTRDSTVGTPVQIAMTRNEASSRLDVKVLVKLDEKEEDLEEWRKNIEKSSSGSQKNNNNICTRGQDALTQIDSYKNQDALKNLHAQDIVKCIGCFTILGLTLPILYNLALGYGFSMACRAKGYDETTCDEYSLDFVLALELPIIFICAYQTYQRCIVDNTFCEDSKSNLLL